MLGLLQYASLIWKRDEVSLKRAAIPFALFGVFAELVGLIPLPDDIRYGIFIDILNPITTAPVLAISMAVGYMLFRDHIYKHHRRPRVTMVCFLMLIALASWVGLVLGMAVSVFGELLPSWHDFMLDIGGLMTGSITQSDFWQHYELFLHFHIAMLLMMLVPEYFVDDALRGSPVARLYDRIRSRFFTSLPTSRQIGKKMDAGGQLAWKRFVNFMRLKHEKGAAPDFGSIDLKVLSC